MKYTLLTFHWKPNDTTAGGSEVSRLAEDNQGLRAEIDKGVYLYRTAEDALYIHRWSEGLRLLRRSFLTLRFEAETCGLSGYFPDDLAPKLKALLGLEIGNLKEPQKPRE